MDVKEAAVYGVSILLFDSLLSAALLSGLVLLQLSGPDGPAAQWALAVARWAALQGFTWALTDFRPTAVLSRLVALLSFLSPVCETFMAPPSGPHRASAADLSRLLLGPACSLFAFALWELGFQSDVKVRASGDALHSSRLLLRMLKYFKPDSLYIIAAFTFLILTVFCKYQNILFPFSDTSAY